MNKGLLVIVVTILAILSGCWDVSQPERMLYVNGVGVDYKDGMYEVSLQFIHFTNVAKSEQPSNEVNQAEVGHAKGETLDDAIFQLYHSLGRKVFWGHFTYLLIAEEAIEK